MCEVQEEVIGGREMERMRREDSCSSRGRKDGRQGEGCWRVKGLSTGHPLIRGQAQRTPQDACFLGGAGGGFVVPGRTQKKPKQRGNGLLK